MKPPETFDRWLTKAPELVAMTRALHGVSVERETFLLPDLWMLHFYDYAGELTIGDHAFMIEPGSVSLAPANLPVGFRYRGPSRHLYAHFRLPFRGRVTPAFWEPDPRLNGLRELLERALSFRKTDPLRASARLWDVLLGLASLKDAPTRSGEEDRVLETALVRLESNLSERVRIAEVARHCGVSINTLGRIFHDRLGVSPVAHLRRCRVNRALELLQHSDQPVKSIAWSVGLPDLHHFNKVLRAETGRSPRGWQERGH
ncbi:MAG: AraC family transcriptional regulator [Verrucomicrobiota bacterium]